MSDDDPGTEPDDAFASSDEHRRSTSGTTPLKSDVDPVVDRRDLLGAIAAVATTPALAGASQADVAEGLPVGDEFPPSGEDTTSLDASTPDDVDQFRRRSWSALHRDHIEYRDVIHDAGSVYTNPDPTWHGVSATKLSLIDAGWESYGNPDPEASDSGCWRYTFHLKSMGMGLMPAHITYDDDENEYVIDEAAGFVPHAIGLPISTDRDEGRKPNPVASTPEWTRLGNEVRVAMPELPEEQSERQDAPQQHLALAARRDRDLFAAINGVGMVHKLRNDSEDRRTFRLGTAPLLDIESQQATVNARQQFENLNERNRDRKAILETAMSSTGIALFAVGLVASGPLLAAAGVVTGVIGLAFAIRDLFKSTDPKPLPYYRGFELKSPAVADQAIAGHHVTFDAYVTPGESVSFDVSSRHQTNYFELDQVSDVTWNVQIDAPTEAASEEAVWDGASVDGGSFWDVGDDDSDRVEPQDAPWTPAAENGPIPGLNLRGGTRGDDVVDVPAVPYERETRFDAYDSVVHDGEIQSYRWAVYRIGGMDADDDATDALAEADWSHRSWPPDPENLSLVTHSRYGGETYEFTPSESAYGPGTYAVVLEVDDGSTSNFTYEPFLVGNVPQPLIYEPKSADGLSDVDVDHAAFPAGKTVSFSGDFRTPFAVSDAAVESYWLIPAEANPDAKFDDPSRGGGRRGSISDEYVVRRGTQETLPLIEPGTYEVEFRTYGSSGVYASTTTTVTVVEPASALDYAPTDALDVSLDVLEEDSTLEVGGHVTLSALETQANGPLELLGYDWDRTGDGAYTDRNGQNIEGTLEEGKQTYPLSEYGFDESGAHEFGVLAYAYDAEADEMVGSTERTTVMVEPTGPRIAAIDRLDPYADPVLRLKEEFRSTGNAPFYQTEDEVVWFSAAASSLTEVASTFRWRFHDDDGVTTREMPVSEPTWHVYAEPGSYEVELEVVYGDGEIASASTTVDVE